MNYPTPIEELLRHTRNHPDKPFLHQPVNRALQVTTWKEAEVNARKVATGLLSLGLKKGGQSCHMGEEFGRVVNNRLGDHDGRPH